MRAQKVLDLQFVFFGGEGAGAVTEGAAHFEHRGGAVQDRLLARRAYRRRIRRPFGARVRVFGEHAFARAGRVDQDLVERGREAILQPRHALVEHDRIAHSEPLYVARQNRGSRGDDFVADEKPLALHRGGELTALAARSGAQVEDEFAGARVEQSCRQHCARLLDVVRSAFVKRRLAGGKTLGIVTSVRTPFDGVERHAEQRFEPRRRHFQGVYSQRRSARRGAQERLPLVGKKAFYAFGVCVVCHHRFFVPVCVNPTLPRRANGLYI